MTADTLRRTLTEAEAAEYLGISISALRQSRLDGPRKNRMPTPPYIRSGRRIFYLPEDLNVWLFSQRVDPCALVTTEEEQ